jgi:hypothetical protein
MRIVTNQKLQTQHAIGVRHRRLVLLIGALVSTPAFQRPELIYYVWWRSSLASP